LYHRFPPDATKKLLRILTDNITVNWDNFSGEYPLHIAVQQGNLPLVQLFLHAGAFVNATTVGRRNAVHRAVMSYSLDNGHDGLLILQELLNYALLQKTITHDEYLLTPVDYAETEGKFQLVDILRARQVFELFIDTDEHGEAYLSEGIKDLNQVGINFYFLFYF
jgi:ankyrin repeat protein